MQFREFERMEQTDQVWRLQAYFIEPKTKVALARNWSTLPVLITVSYNSATESIAIHSGGDAF